MINTFRHPLPQVPCATCDQPLEGIPMDKGDYLFIHDDSHWPAPEAFEKEQANG